MFAVPDGQDGSQIAVMLADGTGERRLTATRGRNFAAAWSPDGRRIAFVSTREQRQVRGVVVGQIFVMNADGTGARRLTDPDDGGADYGVAWSPDGSRLAFVCSGPDLSDDGLCIVGADGSGRRRLLAPGWRAEMPSWSPDGRTIAFSGWSPEETGYVHLWAVSPDGGAPRLLSAARTQSHEDSPAWSPDGEWLAFLATRPVGGVLPELFVMRPDGTERRPVVEGMPQHEGMLSFAWSPDGERMAFVRYGTTSWLSSVRVDGSDLRIVRAAPWGGSGLSWTGSRSP